MHVKTLSAVAVGIAALVVSSATAATAGPSATSEPRLTAVQQTRATGSSFHGFTKKRGCGFTNGTSEAAEAVVSQDLYDFGIVADGADDFTCARATTLKSVRWAGQYFSGEGPAESFNVYVYADNDGEPSDTATCSYQGQKYKPTGPQTGVVDFSIKKLKGQPCKLDAKTTYWLEIQARQSYGDRGPYGWELTLDQTGYPADWRNPDDAFASGCTTFSQPGTGKGLTMLDCLERSGTPDFMFSLK